MKKFFSMLAVFGLLLLSSSCTDESLVGQEGDLVQVTFTISSEGTVSTRSDYVHYPENGQFPQISDGSKAKRLIWAVYDKAGNLLPELAKGYNIDHAGKTNTEVAGYGQVVEDIDNFPHTITITLVRGQEYSFAFWAQDENCNAFNTKDLRAVSVDYKTPGNNLANDELRDAFCKVETFTVTSAPSMERTIILRRPFAQVNVGIPASEYEALRQSGVRIMKSKIHMENVATEFDVVANSTHGDAPEKRQAIDYEYNYIPAYYNYDIEADGETLPTDDELIEGRVGAYPQTQDLKIDLNHDGKIASYGEKNGEGVDARDETYHYMLMAYILPADRNDGTSTYSTTLDKVEFSLLPEDEGQAELTMSLENVPVQRNWRTNIFGNMFTSEVSLQIDLDPFYAGDYNYPEWERIFEGVTYDGMEQCIRISNAAGLVWLANATNGVWETAEDFEKDETHNLDGSANLKNSSQLMLKACGLTEWPITYELDEKGNPTDVVSSRGIFQFKNITIKLDADIDLAVYAELFNTNGYFTPIGFSKDPGAVQHNIPDCYPAFSGIFDGQNHTISNLKTIRPSGIEDGRSFGLFSVIGREAQILNVRLKDIDIEGHYCTGGIAGYAYGAVPDWDGASSNGNIIDNCYVDGGKIVVTSQKIGDSEYDNANNVGGILGYGYNAFTIQNCFVRNLTIRSYRALSGILGQDGGDYFGDKRFVKNNKVYGVTLIADQYQEYGKNNTENRDYEIKDFFVAKQNSVQLSGNAEGDNKIYAFSHPMINGKRTTTIDDTGLLSNPPVDIFPRLVGRYADLVLFKTSVLGGPSAYKTYKNDTDYKGTPDEKSGRVGMWVSNITIDGDTDGNPNTIDNHTITVSNVEGEKDCAMYIVGGATIKNITIHGATYANEGICLKPVAGKTITLDNVLAYDAKKVLTDEGKGNTATLTVKNSNFRGYVSLSEGYYEMTFSETTFEGSTKRAITTTNQLELKGKATLENCKFLVEPGSDYVITVAEDTEFKNCKAYAIGKTGETDGIEITGSCTISVDTEGNVTTSNN